MIDTQDKHLPFIEHHLHRLRREAGWQARPASTSSVPRGGDAPQVVDLSHALEIPEHLMARVHPCGRGAVEVPDAVACVVVDGAILSRLAIGPRAVAQLLGPGDVFCVDRQDPAEPIRHDHRAVIDSTVAVIRAGDPVCGTPSALAAVFEACGRSAQVLTAQHAVTQLTDLETRVAALLPLLTDRWGVMSVDGVLLPAFLTHSLFAELLGVRRPSFTSATPRLAAEGILRRCPDRRWLVGEEVLVPATAPSLSALAVA